MICGAGGQLGRALVAGAPAECEITALTRSDLDIGDGAAVAHVISERRPELILNAAAYTAVDRAESERDAAFRINGEGPGHLAAAAATTGARLVHVSTDFVFDGGQGRPYRPDDVTSPLGVYGASKLAGEKAVTAARGSLIVRTAWVYGPTGSNFLLTMMRLMRERGEVGVVADQVGAPTSAASLASALWRLAVAEAEGLLHFTDAGVASWYDFAVAIAEEALAAGLLERAPRVRPISTSDYPTPARRPAYSVLDASSAYARLGGPAPHWRAALRDVLAEMKR